MKEVVCMFMTTVIKGTMCRNFSHLVVKMYFAFKQIVFSSA